MTTKQLKKAARIILVGAPGVGKGTQTERLLARFPQLAGISSGDLLRENVRNKTPIGEHIVYFIVCFGALSSFTVTDRAGALPIVSSELLQLRSVTNKYMQASKPSPS